MSPILYTETNRGEDTCIMHTSVKTLVDQLIVIPQQGIKC